MLDPERTHPDLGRISWDANLNRWNAQVKIAPGHSINLRINIEDDWLTVDPPILFDLAAGFLLWARTAEPACRDRIADEMLDGYNDNWADDDPEEGAPLLDRVGFVARLRLCGISLYYTGNAEWHYSDGDLFAGHSILISSNENHEFHGSMLFG